MESRLSMLVRYIGSLKDGRRRLECSRGGRQVGKVCDRQSAYLCSSNSNRAPIPKLSGPTVSGFHRPMGFLASYVVLSLRYC